MRRLQPWSVASSPCAISACSYYARLRLSLEPAPLQECEHLVGDQIDVEREREMASVDELDLRRRHDALEAFGALGNEGLRCQRGTTTGIRTGSPLPQMAKMGG